MKPSNRAAQFLAVHVEPLLIGRMVPTLHDCPLRVSSTQGPFVGRQVPTALPTDRPVQTRSQPTSTQEPPPPRLHRATAYRYTGGTVIKQRPQGFSVRALSKQDPLKSRRSPAPPRNRLPAKTRGQPLPWPPPTPKPKPTLQSTRGFLWWCPSEGRCTSQAPRCQLSGRPPRGTRPPKAKGRAHMPGPPEKAQLLKVRTRSGR
jgi:hypothetical protein